MKKKVWIGITALIVLIAIGATYLLYPLISRIRPKTLSNVTELYSLFTPYMLDFVNSRQAAMNCQPTQFYYLDSVNNTQFCLVCGKFDICYGYAWVNRNGVMLMNPTELFLVGEYNQKTLLNLYSYGVADVLNCDCTNKECSCENGITARIAEFGNIFTFPKNVNIMTEVENIARKMGKYPCEAINNATRIKCGDLVAAKISENEVVFGT
jgi:hypothetical protein